MCGGETPYTVCFLFKVAAKKNRICLCFKKNNTRVWVKGRGTQPSGRLCCSNLPLTDPPHEPQDLGPEKYGWRHEPRDGGVKLKSCGSWHPPYFREPSLMAHDSTLTSMEKKM